jgi:hypothetical protein
VLRTIEFFLEIMLKPMFYIPHICLQNILWSLDNAASKQSALAWSVLLVFGRVCNLVIMLVKFNMYVSLTHVVHVALT